MKELEDRIIKDGIVINSDIINLGSFLNQKIDIDLLLHQAEEVKKSFSDINKVLTIEASGLPFATLISHLYGVDMVFAKKTLSKNVSGEVLTSKVKSFTKSKEYEIFVNKNYITKEDKVLIVDDFLANGNAINGLINLCKLAHAKIVGIAVQVEKVYQNGGNNLRDSGYKVLSLAQIKEIKGNKIIF